VDIALLAANKISVISASFCVQQAVESLLDACESTMKSKSVKFSKIMPSIPLWIKSDRYRLKQLTLNVVSNALNNMEANDSLSIRLSIENKHESRVGFALVLRDTGPGYTEEELTHLYQRYIHIINSTSTTYETDGLGLAVSKGLTGLLGGSMQVQSVKHSSTTFVLTFECETGEQYGNLAKAVSDALLSRQSLSSSKRVLVVDDNRINLQILVRTMQKCGYECVRKLQTELWQSKSSRASGLTSFLWIFRCPTKTASKLLLPSELSKRTRRELPHMRLLGTLVMNLGKELCWGGWMDT
jgi:hypothetical protein